MRRFGYNDDDFPEDVNHFFNISDDDDDDDFEEDFDEDFDEDDPVMTEMIQIEIASQDLNQKIFSTALQIAEKTWFWNFKSISSKLNLIKKIYSEIEDFMFHNKKLETDDEKEE